MPGSLSCSIEVHYVEGGDSADLADAQLDAIYQMVTYLQQTRGRTSRRGSTSQSDWSRRPRPEPESSPLDRGSTDSRGPA
jgi:hypothetical protein